MKICETVISANPAANPKPQSRVVLTAGEVFTDGSAIDLVDPAGCRQPSLLYWNGKEATIAPEIEHDSVIYRPVELPPHILKAIPLPNAAKEYGTTRRLFDAISRFFEQRGLPGAQACLATGWILTTWIADCLPVPVTLVVFGPNMPFAVQFLLLLGCFAYHPLVLTDITCVGFSRLTERLRVTLLVNQPGLPSKIRYLWRNTNHRGVFAENRGVPIDAACAKAVFLGTEAPADPWSGEAIHLELPRGNPPLLLVDQRVLNRITTEWQPALLQYRLRYLSRMGKSSCNAADGTPPTDEIARILRSCVEGEPELGEFVVGALRPQRQDVLLRLSRDPSRAIIEVVWNPWHGRAELTTSQVTELANALLQQRGEIDKYSAVEVGLLLRSLGLCRHRNAKGMTLPFNRETSVRLHQLARDFGLNLPVMEGCPDCLGGGLIAEGLLAP